jgi:hypothetical protein
MRLLASCWGVILVITVVSPFAVAQVTYCRSGLAISEQTPEQCRQRGRPSVTVAVPSRPTKVESLKVVQLQLETLGFHPGPSDGVLGPATIYAIRQFQRSIGLDPDGVITSELQSQLDQRTRPKGTVPNVVEALADTVAQAQFEGSQVTSPSPVSKSRWSNYDHPNIIVLTAIIFGLLAVVLGVLTGFACLVLKVTSALKNEALLRAVHPIVALVEARLSGIQH